MWIHNPLTKENTKINKDESIPEGWFQGRVSDDHKQLKIEEKDKKKIKSPKKKRRKAKRKGKILY